LEQLPDWDEWIDMEADLINSLKKDFNPSGLSPFTSFRASSQGRRHG